MLVAATRPSTAPDEYDSSNCGVGPGAGGTSIGYDQVKSPDCRPTCQVADGASEVGWKLPALPFGPAASAYSPSLTWALTRPARTSLRDATGVSRLPSTRIIASREP